MKSCLNYKNTFFGNESFSIRKDIKDLIKVDLLITPTIVIKDHSIKFDHSVEVENFKITNSATINFELNIKESILIKQMSSSLNDNGSLKPYVL